MPGLKPFWRYFGGKWRAAPRYPAPKHDTIIEPFAGAAGYSLRYPDRRVILVEKYWQVAAVWRFLICGDPAMVRDTPADIEHVDELPEWVPLGLRWLIGFSLGAGISRPNNCLSAGLRKFRDSGVASSGWCASKRERVASQMPAIRHWQIVQGDYTGAPDVEATWFVDPPYQRAGINYVHSSKAIDFTALGAWCRTRSGQTIVCEADGANWLPFRPFMETNSIGGRTSAEVIWMNPSV